MVLASFYEMEGVPPPSAWELEALMCSAGLKLVKGSSEAMPPKMVVLDDDEDELLDFVLPYKAAQSEGETGRGLLHQVRFDQTMVSSIFL